MSKLGIEKEEELKYLAMNIPKIMTSTVYDDLLSGITHRLEERPDIGLPNLLITSLLFGIYEYREWLFTRGIDPLALEEKFLLEHGLK